jgi:DNA-binding response OmpR family regulator
MESILIVDDQACVRELLTEELIREGYRVKTAGDRESAKASLRFSPPDLVLLDLYLDGLEGREVLRDIKRQDPHLPVLIVTAYDSFADDPGLSLADGYVVKSADFRELKKKIANAIRRKAGPQTKVEAKRPFSRVRVVQSV